MTCPACLRPPKLKQFRQSLECASKHIVCAECKLNLQKKSECPYCRGYLWKMSRMRCRQAQRLLLNYKYECRFFGCNASFFENQIFSHERNCLKKTIVCPWTGCPKPEILEQDILARKHHGRHFEHLETDALDIGWDFLVPIYALLNLDCNIKDYSDCAFPKLLLLRDRHGNISRHFRLTCMFYFQKFQYSNGCTRNTVNLSLHWPDALETLITPQGRRYLQCRFKIVLYDHVCFGKNYIRVDPVEPKFKTDYNPHHFMSGMTIFPEHLMESLKRNLFPESCCKVCGLTTSTKDPRISVPHFHVKIQKL